MKEYILLALFICLSPLSYCMEDISTSTKEKSEEKTISNEEQERLNDELLSAAFGGKQESAKTFLEAGANVDARDKKDNTPLILASRQGHKALVDLFLSKGARVNAQNNDNATAIEKAAYWDKKAVVASLVKAGAHFGMLFEQGMPGYFYFAQRVRYLPEDVNKGNVEEVRKELTKVESLTSSTFIDKDGNTLLHKAVKGSVAHRSHLTAPNYRQIIKVLLGHTPELLNQKNNAGQTPLDMAFEDPNTLKILVVAAHRLPESKEEETK